MGWVSLRKKDKDYGGSAPLAIENHPFPRHIELLEDSFALLKRPSSCAVLFRGSWRERGKGKSQGARSTVM
jgi:hypothetical protein